jgi:hypothetical protein
LSEEGGYFDTDNLISNETAYVQVVDRLEPLGGAYLGVGPQQNFSYIARLRPRWAFIVDIRRENMFQHLLFNAIFAQAQTPYQYLCWLFSKPIGRKNEVPLGAPLEEIVAAVEKGKASKEVCEKNFDVLLNYIENELEIELSAGDRDILHANYTSFFREQLDIRFHSHNRPPMPHHPTLRGLLLARSEDGAPAHFLASPEGYTYLRQLAASGRLVPVVGDFAGSHTLRAIGDFLEERGETVSAFYVSNVEFYLMRTERFGAYVDNVRSLPLNGNSLFIRAYFDYGHAHPARLPGHRSTVVLQRIRNFLGLYDARAYRSYWDVCAVDYMVP